MTIPISLNPPTRRGWVNKYFLLNECHVSYGIPSVTIRVPEPKCARILARRTLAFRQVVTVTASERFSNFNREKRLLSSNVAQIIEFVNRRVGDPCWRLVPHYHVN